MAKAISASSAVDAQLSVAQRFAPYLLNQGWYLARAYVVSLLGVALSLALPWPIKFLIDDVLNGSTTIPWLIGFSQQQQVIVLAISIALIAGLAAYTLGIDKILHARVRERFGYSLREALIQQVYRLSRSSRQAQRSGELSLRLVSDVQQVSRLFCKTTPTAFKHLLVAIGALGLTFYINTVVGFVALSTAVLLATLMIYFGPKLKAAAGRKRDREGDVSALTQETMKGIEHVQAMGLENKARRRYLADAAAALEAGVDEVRVAVHLERSSQIMAGLALALVAGIGGTFVVDGSLSLGSLTVCIAYLTQLLKPIEKINETAASISRGIVRAERLEAVFLAELALPSNPDGKMIDKLNEIDCRALVHHYTGNAHPILNGIDARFRRGECTALVGPSGSGKTTLLRLLLRLDTPGSGELFADGVQYSAIEPISLRSQFAVVQQNAHLFAGSMREVLTELRSDLTEERIRQALFDVRLLELVDSLPSGLETPIDESGDRVSGGQLARLMLARALLAERPVLILDEPFANIDLISKRIILSRLEHAKQERILIVVTHEQELLELADHVIEFDDPQPTSGSTINYLQDKISG